MRPGLVARPADTDEVAEVLRAAAAHGLTVVPRGRGTKLSWGLPPDAAPTCCSTSARLDQVLDHAAGDLIVGAQAGARLADVQDGRRPAAASGSPSTRPSPAPRIGGTLATNTSGAAPRRRPAPPATC